MSDQSALTTTSAMEDVKTPDSLSASNGGGGGGGGGAADADADMDGSQDPDRWNQDHALSISKAVIPTLPTSVYQSAISVSSGRTVVYLQFGSTIVEDCVARVATAEARVITDEKKQANTKKRKGGPENLTGAVRKQRNTVFNLRWIDAVILPLSQSYNRILFRDDCASNFADISACYDSKEISLSLQQMTQLARVAEITGNTRRHTGVTAVTHLLTSTTCEISRMRDLVESNSFPDPARFVYGADQMDSPFVKTALAAFGQAPGTVWVANFWPIIVQYAPFGQLTNVSPAFCLRALATHGLFITDHEMFIEAYAGLMANPLKRPSIQLIHNFVCPGCLSTESGCHLSDCPMECNGIRPPAIISCMRGQVLVLNRTWDLFMFADNIVTWLYRFYTDVIQLQFVDKL